MATLKDLRAFRLQKLEKLKELGINPYPSKSHRDTENKTIITGYEKFEGREVTVAGRITSIRTHGGVCFIDTKDQSGKIQLYIKQEILVSVDHSNNELRFDEIDLLDLGDFVEGQGKVIKTPRGEISVELTSLRLLTKAIRPSPAGWDGLKDKETRLRRRYLDLQINDEVAKRFERRFKFFDANRSFLKEHGFVEVDTPVLEHATGGADATPFVTHHNYLDEDFYLRISTELFQKRLVGGGMEKIFTIGPNFRNEGLSDEHHQEYVQIEWYWAYASYKDNMQLVKEAIRYIAQEVYGKSQFTTRGHTFDLQNEWEEVDYIEVLKKTYGLDIFHTSLEELKRIAQKHHVAIDADANDMRIIDALWKDIRKKISGPAFLINEPAFMSPLAKSKQEDSRLTERFHVILAGSELGNGYSELNDPQDQLDRFKDQQNARESGDTEAQMLDIDYVEMLEYGMPPCSGYGHSERLFWFFEDIPSREGVIFPQLRQEIDQDTRDIYPELFSNGKAKNNDGEVKQDFSRKLVVVLNKELPSWQAMNALSHISAFIGNKMDVPFDTGNNFITKDEIAHPRNSQFSFIILSAKPGQFQNFINKVRESGLLYHGFIREMIETTDDREIEKILSQKNDTDIEYLGIGVFGLNEEVDKLTKNFSLWK